MIDGEGVKLPEGLMWRGLPNLGIQMQIPGLSSKLSSSWIVSALAFLLIGKASLAHFKNRKISDGIHPSGAATKPLDLQLNIAPQIVQTFIYGFAIASTLFGIYFLIQHLTGFDYRLEGYTLGDNRLMNETRYRVSGFFGHPLSAAGVTLVTFTFFWTLTFSFGKQNWTASLPGFDFKHLPKVRGDRFRLLTCYIALLNLSMLFMTGGRTAIIIGILVIFITPFFLRHSRITPAFRFVFLFTITICILLGAVYSGAHDRFIELINQFREVPHQNIERLVFWKVYLAMIADSPLFGHGAAHISDWVRDAYYSKLGYENFHQKYNAHNNYLEIIASIGLIGFAIFIFSVGCMLKILSRWSKISGILQAIYLAILVSLAANAVHCLTQNVFFDANVLVIYFGFLWFFYWTADRT